MREPGQSEPRVKCCSCGGKVISTGGRYLSENYREITYVCIAEDCGIRFVSALYPLRIIAPPDKCEALNLPIVKAGAPPQQVVDDIAA